MPTRRLQALGRLKPGQRNRTEAAYEQTLSARKNAGEILWYAFEAIKLRLADNCFLTVDFSVMRADGVLEMVDVKGSPAIFQDDARVKLKVAAEKFPFIFTVAYPVAKRLGGGWKVEEF